MLRGLVFSGQGSHRKGMGMDLVGSPATAALWERMKECMMLNFGLPLQEVIGTNPTKIHMLEDAFDVEAAIQRSCKEIRNTPESAPRTRVVTNPNGVMQLTTIAQPCVLAAHMLTLEKMKETMQTRVTDYAAIAGHSLGELSALCALGVFTPETALNLTFKRGLLMEAALAHHRRDRHLMYACNPVRAKLHDDPQTASDFFFLLVELVSRTLSNTTSFVEVANYNLAHEQYVVAGDLVALSVLGKCMDPQFRANSPHSDTLDGIVRDALAAVKLDKVDGITMQPNLVKDVDFVTSAKKRYGARMIFRRFARGLDDGATPSPEKLTHLTLEEDGRSGLKKKSWFIPLAVEIPFHTSALRKCSDQFLPIVRSALPEEGELRELLSVNHLPGSPLKRPLWITNLTGTTFAPFDKAFQDEARDVMSSLNVGEVQHSGRHSSDLLLRALDRGVEEESVVDICAAVLAAQLSHSVLWIDDMEHMVLHHRCTMIDEIAPSRNVSEMFKRSKFIDASQNNQVIPVATKCYPADGDF